MRSLEASPRRSDTSLARDAEKSHLFKTAPPSWPTVCLRTPPNQRRCDEYPKNRPDIRSERLVESREFYASFLGLDVAMDTGSITTFVSPSNPTAQVSVLSNDESASVAPNLTVEVADVDAAHAQAVRRELQIVYPLTNERWGVRRFFVMDPNGMVVNLMRHRSGATSG